MKKSISPLLQWTLPVTFLLMADYSAAQCNVNDKYDKIISGYHSSIALKDNGTYAVWGSYMQSSGAADQLSPQDINSTNYSLLTGAIYKAALGGKSAGAQVDQAILLTSTGLWAWGVAGNVVSTTVKSGAAFGRTSTTAANGFNTYGLPSTLAPADVSAVFATYQTLILLTTSGNVWILTQTSLAAEANGGAVASTGTSQWKQVKINASTYLSNVIAVRGQVYNTSNNAFIAMTSTGEVYTWGNTSYLGNGTTATARNYATLMTLPAEFSSSVPKMIGVTGGGGTGATTVKNTYYILSNAGNMYSLGDNTHRQCGDFTTTERTSWVNVKKSAASNDNLTNINFFSCQEHNASFPACASITTTGDIYTWGNNSSGMCGRTDNGLPAGTITTVSFNPGIPVGFSGKAISVEMGGHTLVYTKEGSTQFCYVGHYTNGSMGDGTAGNNGGASATSLKHDCSSTPSIAICGYVPVAASAVNSMISASQAVIQANGSSVSIITIQLKDASGNNLTSSGGVVVISTTAGAISMVTDNNNGTYTAILTSSIMPATTTLSFTVNGTAASASTQVQFTATTLPLKWVNILVFREQNMVKINWTTESEVNVKNYTVERSFDALNWVVIMDNIVAVNQSGLNYYQQTDTSNLLTRKIFYRIKQTDFDGRYSISPVRMVFGTTVADKISIYPVPAGKEFFLGNVHPAEVKEVQLITMNGSMLKSWKTFQANYDLTGISRGNYIIRVEMKNGPTQILRLNKY